MRPTLPVPPPDCVEVTEEALRLAPEPPTRWIRGTMLAALTGGRTVPVPGALLADQLVLRRGGLVLEEGRDYLIDRRWGTLGVAPGGRVTPDDVEASYRYTLLRLDSIALVEGAVQYLVGEPHLSAPVPAATPGGGSVVANVLVRQTDAGPDVDVFPVSAGPGECTTRTTEGGLARTMAKLGKGEPTKIVCWGDSITVGGDAEPGNRYVDVLTRGLHVAYPSATITVETVAVGGSSSVHWIYPDEYRHPIPEWQRRCDWRRIEEAEPDLVTIEFVNDCGRTPDELARTYGEILRRLGRRGPEVAVITPPFTEMQMMGLDGLRDEDRRPYVAFLHALAAEHDLALADASARWAHLWREGIPYITLLRNGSNHPEDRGHALLAEELLRCLGAGLAPADRARLYPA